MINVSLPTFCMSENQGWAKKLGGVGENRHMAREWFGLLAVYVGRRQTFYVLYNGVHYNFWK